MFYGMKKKKIFFFKDSALRRKGYNYANHIQGWKGTF